MPGRKFSASGSYRYGFNGKENDNEVKGDGNSLDYGDRMYDPRIGRWLSIDAYYKKYPMMTPFSYAGNTPVLFIDPDGNDIILPWKADEFAARLSLLFDNKLTFNVVYMKGTINDHRLRPNDLTNYSEAELKGMGLNEVQVKAYIYIFKLATDPRRNVKIDPDNKDISAKPTQAGILYDVQPDDFDENKFYLDRTAGLQNNFEDLNYGVTFLHYLLEQVYDQIEGPKEHANWGIMDRRMERYRFSHEYALKEGMKIFGFKWEPYGNPEGRTETKVVAIKKGNKVIRENQIIYIQEVDIIDRNGNYLGSLRFKNNVTTGEIYKTEPFKRDDAEVGKPLPNTDSKENNN